jgi:hypothetical protein
VVRYRRKYYATNRLSLTAPEVRQLYRLRQEIEEVIRVLKSQLKLEGCQAGYTRSTQETTDSQPQPQTHHIALCLVAYLIVERERFEWRMTWRQFKRHLILKKPHPHCLPWSGSEWLRKFWKVCLILANMAVASALRNGVGMYFVIRKSGRTRTEIKGGSRSSGSPEVGR